jgi:hypothetical protein
MKSCGYCGRDCAWDARYCDGCGTEFLEDEAPPETPPKVSARPVSKPSILPLPAVSIEGEPLDIAGIDMGYSDVEGFSRPNWPQIRKQIEEQFREADRLQVWVQVARQWITQLCEDLGGNYTCYESDRFLLLSAESDEDSDAMLGIAERAMAQLWERLGGVAWRWQYGKQVILAFNEVDDYYTYISFFYADGHHALSSGVFLKRDYCHLIVPFHSVWAIKTVIIHELSHNCLAHLRIPLWLNEGVSQRMERELAWIGKDVLLDRELASEHHEWWNETNIQDFWAGKSFHIPGQSQKLSYSLGQILVEVFSEDWPSVLNFIAHADFRDSGQDAALRFLGRPLEDAVAGFLGPGNWRPNRKAIAERMVRESDRR